MTHVWPVQSGKLVINRILSSMPPADFAELAPHLKYTNLRRGESLQQPGGPNPHVYFIQDGLIVFTKMMHDGRGTMIGCAGVEGMSTWSMRTDIECSVVVEGSALVIDAKLLERKVGALPRLGTTIWRYATFMGEQIAQLSGCNRLHSLEQRCARVLLTIHDSVKGQEFGMTQEALAAMLGAQRPHVSAVAAHLRDLKLIQYTHGSIRVTNPAGLKVVCCECYTCLREQAGNGTPHQW